MSEPATCPALEALHQLVVVREVIHERVGRLQRPRVDGEVLRRQGGEPGALLSNEPEREVHVAQCRAGRDVAPGPDEHLRLVQAHARIALTEQWRERGAHRIEGIGIGYRPPMWDARVVNEVLAVHTDDAEGMARRLAREEGLFAGTSSGANVVAAIRVGQRLGPKARVVTLLVDSGLKYLSSGVFRRAGGSVSVTG